MEWPHEPKHELLHVQLERGEQFARRGQLHEAEAVLREALKLAPDNPLAIDRLARVLLSLQRAPEALQLVEAFLHAHPLPEPTLLLLRAQMLAIQRLFPAAISAFHQAIDVDPTSGTAELGLAMALGEDGQVEDASDAARRAMAKGADSPGARYVLARALFDAGRFDEAIAAFRSVLTLQPDHPAAHASLAELLWMRTGDLVQATATLDAALQQRPGQDVLRISKASLLSAAGQPERAIAELELGLSGAAGASALHLAAAKTAIGIQPHIALNHARRALASAPRDPVALGIYADTLLANGDACKAAIVAGQLYRHDPTDNHALAVLATAWRQLDDARYRDLYDYARFIQCTPIDVPEGWSNLGDYLRDLAACLHRSHGFTTHPVHQSVRHGTQVDHRMDARQDHPIRAFAQAIDGPVRRYLAALGKGNDPLRRRQTGDYRLSGLWSVRVGPGGNHLSHYHGKGWLSSACYIQLPPSMDNPVEGGGWLTFGEPAVSGPDRLEAEYFLRPQPGLLVLFPSWMWHGTRPFTGGAEDRRLTMAFDVVPA